MNHIPEGEGEGEGEREGEGREGEGEEEGEEEGSGLCSSQQCLAAASAGITIQYTY